MVKNRLALMHTLPLQIPDSNFPVWNGSKSRRTKFKFSVFWGSVTESGNCHTLNLVDHVQDPNRISGDLNL